jgi:hypothetical protein
VNKEKLKKNLLDQEELGHRKHRLAKVNFEKMKTQMDTGKH